MGGWESKPSDGHPPLVTAPLYLWPMATKLQRWIDLLAALLRRNYPVSFEELIRDVPGYQDPDQEPESRRRMFERDKDGLRGFGIPILTRDIGDNEIGYLLRRTDFYLPYLSVLEDGRPIPIGRAVDRFGYRSLPTLAFEPEELRAIEEVGRRIPGLRVPSIFDDVRSALRKLGASPPPAEPEATTSAALAAVFDRLNDALGRRKRVTLAYHSFHSESRATRVLEPYGLFFLGHHWYLAAVEQGQEVVKNFRLSRMSDVAVNGLRPGTPDYTIPETFVLRDHARSRQAWELGASDATEATVAIVTANGATRAVARLGEEVDGHPDRRSFRVRRLDPFARWLLGFAGGVTPIAPAELVTLHQEMVRNTLARYQGGAA